MENLTKSQILIRLEELLKREEKDALHKTFSLVVAESIFNESDKEEARDLVTLTEYLERENIIVDEKSFYTLAVRVTKEFIKEYGVKPRRVNRKSPVTGKYNNKAYAYTREQTKVIDRVLETLPYVKNPRK
ncbi:MAG: hypothetical protein RM021_011860 [Nostoc sp. EkiNYC01]